MSWDIPLFDIELEEADRTAITRVLDSRWLTMGQETIAFEEEFAAFVGVPHAGAVANCTAALHLCLRAFDIGPGDEVVCPSRNNFV